MANPQHLDWLKRGEAHWKQWRQAHPDLCPDLKEAYLSGIDLSEADLSRADLSGADLSSTTLWQTNFWGATLTGTIFIRADLSRAILSSATLRRAALYRANLSGAQLSRADLSTANLSRADLSGAQLSGARLRGVKLAHANLTGAICNGTDLSHAEVGWTLFGDLDLSTVKGLETVQHLGPSIIGIETIYRSRGNIAVHFLRQAGVPETFLTYMHALIDNPIDYYDCFLYYASKDYAFARRLHADLQSEGVRCWLTPYDHMDEGAYHAHIDESIRLSNKMLLVFSRDSVDDPAVAQEVETLLAKEHQEHRLILLPIRIDSAIMEQESGWPAHIRATRPIEDFTRWKRYDIYQKALQRLLCNLKTDSPVADVAIP